MQICSKCIDEIELMGEFCLRCFLGTCAVRKEGIANIYPRGSKEEIIMKFLEIKGYVITTEIDLFRIEGIPNYTNGQFDLTRSCYCWNSTHFEEKDSELNYQNRVQSN